MLAPGLALLMDDMIEGDTPAALLPPISAAEVSTAPFETESAARSSPGPPMRRDGTKRTLSADSFETEGGPRLG